MTSCPNKSSQEYKEMVNALGDNLTHYIWDKNNGNPIHKAPNGKDSKLFNDLVELLGSKEEAIKAKARVYSKNFRNWFGDWLGNDKTNVSKVVDENGEPLMVYHGTNQFGFTNFKKEKLGEFTQSSSAKLGFFFSNNMENSLKYSINLKKDVSFDDEGKIDGMDGTLAIDQLNETIEYAKKGNEFRYNGYLYSSSYWMPSPKYYKKELSFESKEEQINKDEFENIQNIFINQKEKEKKKFIQNESKMRLYPLFLSSKTLSEFNDEGNEWREESYVKRINEALIENKDGVVIKNTYDPLLNDVYIVFEPNQIKSAILPSQQQKENFNLDENEIGKFNESNDNIYYQNNTNQSDEDYVASEKTIRDLAARMADRIGLEVKYISDRTQNFKGKLKNNVATINLAYATLDTPIHEILGHPIIRTIKDRSLNTEDSRSRLYENLIEELSISKKGKEVLNRVKKNYQFKKIRFTKIDIFDNHNLYKQLEKQAFNKGRTTTEDYGTGEFEEVLNGTEVNIDSKTYLYFNTIDKQGWYESIRDKYTLEEQQEEAIVELLGLYTADRLDKVKDGKLISLLKRLLKEMKSYLKSIFNNKEVNIDELPDNMTLGDLADLLTYRNNKLILPGNTIKYTTPDNQTFKTYREASNHISDLFKKDKIDLNNIDLDNIPDQFDTIEGYVYKDDKDFYITHEEEILDNEQVTVIDYQQANRKISKEYALKLYKQTPDYKENSIINFISKNKEYEQSKKIIEKWKEENNIQYDPEEVYSRGQGFYSVVGAYSRFDVKLMFQNLLTHIEDNKKSNGEFTISALTKPTNRRLNHIEGSGGKIRFKIFPKSKDIKWASNVDVNSGSVWDASKKFNKNKKSEIIGVSYTKAPASDMINTIQPNLANIIDNIAHTHNELGIELTTNNFRLEYDEDIPYSIKKILDTINNILDQKYGKLEEPEIYNNPKQPIQTKKNLKESIESIKSKRYSKDISGIENIKDITVSKFTIESPKLNNIKIIFTKEDGKWFKSKQGAGKREVNSNEEVVKAYNLAQQEYISQAEINIKVVALKEGFRKYPRSLIRSEVINNKMFNDTMYQTLQQKEEFNLNENKIGRFDKNNDNINYKKITNEYFNSKNNTIQTTLSNLNNTPNSKLGKKVLNRLQELKIDDNVPVILVDEDAIGDNKALYAENKTTDDEYIMIDKSRIESKSDFERSVVHEIIHYTAAKSLKKNGELAQEWKTYYEQIKTLFTEKELNDYNIKDEDEFLAEIFTSKELQQRLSEMNPINEKSKYKNLWQEVWVDILNIIGINPENSLFKEAFAFGTHIIENGLNERSKGELKGIHIDSNYRKDDNKLNSYNKILLKDSGELLKDENRAIYHFDTKNEYNKLLPKIIKINKTQSRVIAFIGKTWGEDNRHSKREYLSVMFHQLTDEQIFLRKAHLLSLDNNNKLKYNTSLKTVTAAHRMEDRINEVNKKMTKFKFYIKEIDNLYSIDVKLNDKYIDDLVAMIKNYDIEIDTSMIARRFKNNNIWNNMVNKLGLDLAIKIYKLNGELLLNDLEISEFIEKYNGEIKPTDNYDNRFKINDEESTEYDNAINYTEDEESDINDETVSKFLDDLIYDSSVESLNIDYTDKNTDLPEQLGFLINDFKTKMKERLSLMLNQLGKVKDKKEKNKIRLSVKALHKLIYTTPYNEVNLWTMVNSLTTDLKELKMNLDNNAIDITKLNYYKNVLDLWDIIIKDWRSEGQNKFHDYIKGNYQFQKTLINQVAVINELHQEILKLHNTLYVDSVNGIMNNKIKLKELETIKEIGGVKSMWLDLSRTGNKLTDSIFKVLNNASNISSINFKLFNEELLKRMDSLSKTHDLTKKSTQMKLLETDDGVLTGNIIGRYIPQFSVNMDTLKKLRRKINNKKSKNLLWISSDIRELENKSFDYVDLNELINEEGLLSKSKLEAYKNELLKKYDIDKVNDIIDDIKEKDQLFKDTAIAVKEHMHEQIMINTKYETFRAKRSHETDKEYNDRIDDLLQQEFQLWYSKNNPYGYLKRRNKSNVILNGTAYKYIPYIPKTEYESNKFKDLQKETELYDFYKWYVDKLNKYKEYLPPTITDKLLYNFLPRLKQDLAQKLRDGNNAIKSIQDTVLENNTVEFASVVKRLDAMGNEIHKIPVNFLSLSSIELKIMLDSVRLKLSKASDPRIIDYLTKQEANLIKRIDSIQNEMSTDLVKIIKSFAIMAENFRAFNNVEDTVKTGQTILNNITKVISNKNTKQTTKKGDVTNMVKGAENLIEATDYTINALMYGERKEHRQIGTKVIFNNKEIRKKYNNLNARLKVIRNEFVKGKIGQYEKWRKESEIENEIDELIQENSPKVLTTNTVAHTATNITGIANLGFNIKSAVNNVLFGKVSLHTHAVGGEDFNIEEYKQADKIILKALRIGGDKQLNSKLKHLSDLYNVVFEVNEAAYGAKSALAEKTKWLDIVKPYGMTKKGEYYLQNIAMIAMLLHTKINVIEKLTNKKLKITLWDAYNSDGSFKSKYSYLNSNTNQYEDNNTDYTPPTDTLKSSKFMALLDHIQQVNKLIHGNYDPRSPMQIKGKDWGTVLMQYKTWVPEGWAQRFEKDIEDDMLGRHRKGRYRTAYEVGLWKSLGVYITSFFSNKKISPNDYTAIDYANMKKNLVEFRYIIILGMAQYSMRLMVSALKGKDDELYLRALRTLLNQLSRLNNDLSFYFNPRNALNTAKEPFPAIQYTIKWMDWLVRARKLFTPGFESKNYTFGKWVWYGAGQIPGLNEVKKWSNEMKKINGD